MKKIALFINVLVTFLFSFSAPFKVDEEVKLLSENNSLCNVYDTVVNITNTSNSISVSGVIILKQYDSLYIATSSKYYKKNYDYEIIFNDYSRKRAEFIGIANEDEIMVLKVVINNSSYCSAKLSRSEYLDIAERVDVIGNYYYSPSIAEGYISQIGICKNCNEETYKNYYYSLLNLDIENNHLGSGVYDKKGNLLGIITNKLEKNNMEVKMIDVDKLYAIVYNFANYGKYNKNYIKYNLLNVNSLTKEEKYLYSLDEELTSGVLVSSVHYLNYFIGGLNLGMVIEEVNGVRITNKYELDIELSKYIDGSEVNIKVLKTNGKYKTYRIKL